MKTTFWFDFSVADKFGKGAVKDTYNNGLEYAQTDVHYYAEFVLVLNHKIWQHYKAGNKAMATLYDELWRKADRNAYNVFTGEEEQAIYFNMTD